MSATANQLLYWLVAVTAVVIVSVLSASIVKRVGEVMLRHVASVAMYNVRPALLARAGWLLQNRWSSPLAAPRGLAWRAYAAADSGQTAAALAHVDEMLQLVAQDKPLLCPWYFVNSATDIYINGGKYQKACSAADLWSPEAQALGRDLDPSSYAFTLINRAEALHNLGRNDDALTLLRVVEEQASLHPLPPLGRHGLLLAKAWILVHLGRTTEAGDQLSLIDPNVLGRRYGAEYFFTGAVVLCASGDLAAAEAAANDGSRHAKRAASRRNALQIAARVAVAQGRHDRAIDLLEAARTLTYQAQGAPGLVLLGQCYEAAGHPERARQSYSDALAADPESSLCLHAKERLTALALEGDPAKR